ncbi:hypothetical protein [Bradyrhizobium oligotrophicum]|uniref:hypothetical protein n=1 Tax=Bradyrhizobium oligotrophicum TaxID=44255 RepID=UPI003EC13041
MSKKLLTLSPDKKSITDDAGNVLYVACNDKDGSVYYDKPENITKGKVCIGWEEESVCVGWDAKHELCLKVKAEKFCISWSSKD